MTIKLKHSKNGKRTAEVRDEVQAAAFLKEGFVGATKTDEDKLNGVFEEVADPPVVDPPGE